MTQYITQADINSEYESGELFKYLENAGAKIIDFVAVGPAGGNPCLTLSFESEESAIDFVLDHHECSDVEWAKEQITKKE